MDRAARREKALVIWEDVIRLIPNDVHVSGALFDVMPEVNEVAEEICEHLRSWRAYPKATKEQLFFDK